MSVEVTTGSHVAGFNRKLDFGLKQFFFRRSTQQTTLKGRFVGVVAAIGIQFIKE